MKREALQYMPGLIAVCLGLIGNSSAMLAQSAPGVTDKEILIGSCSALEGLSHFLGTETINGAKAYFETIPRKTTRVLITSSPRSFAEAAPSRSPIGPLPRRSSFRAQPAEY